MLVGVLRFEIVLRESYSLKDKRRIVRSLRDRLRNQFNVSIAEVGSLDQRQFAELGVSTVGTERRALCSLLDQVLNLARATPGVELIRAEEEFF